MLILMAKPEQKCWTRCCFLFEQRRRCRRRRRRHHCRPQILKVSLLRNCRKSCCSNKLDLLIGIRHRVFCILWLSERLHVVRMRVCACTILIEILTACVDMWNALISLHYILNPHTHTNTTHLHAQPIEIMPLYGSQQLKQLQLS